MCLSLVETKDTLHGQTPVCTTHTHMRAHTQAPMHIPVVISSNNYSQYNQWLQNHSCKLEAELYVAMDIMVCLEE